MTKIFSRGVRSGLVVVSFALLCQAVFANENKAQKLREWWAQHGEQYQEQKNAIYERMKRYGITREDIHAYRRLLESPLRILNHT